MPRILLFTTCVVTLCAVAAIVAAADPVGGNTVAHLALMSVGPR